jgi:hypothetical protein
MHCNENSSTRAWAIVMLDVWDIRGFRVAFGDYLIAYNNSKSDNKFIASPLPESFNSVSILVG